MPTPTRKRPNVQQSETPSIELPGISEEPVQPSEGPVQQSIEQVSVGSKLGDHDAYRVDN